MDDPRHFFRLTLALLTLIFSGVLALAAWPRLLATLEYLPVDTALSRYAADRVIPSAQLDGLAERARNALAHHEHHRYWSGLSLIHQLKSLDPATPAWLREPALYRALDAGRESVSRSPAQPMAWLRLAQVHAQLGHRADEVAPPLAMSMLTGRVEPAMLLPRLQLAYLYLPQLDGEARSLLRDQTRLAWQVDPGGFLEDVRSGGLPLERIRELLGDADPEWMKQLEAVLEAPA